jgi:hypothetical protein
MKGWSAGGLMHVGRLDAIGGSALGLKPGAAGDNKARLRGLPPMSDRRAGAARLALRPLGNAVGSGRGLMWARGSVSGPARFRCSIQPSPAIPALERFVTAVRL